MATETSVQIEVPRTGQKIRNLSVSAIQSDGTIATVLMQVVALSDENGALLDLSGLDLLNDLVMVAKQQRGLLRLLVGKLLNVKIDGQGLEDLL